MVPPGLLLGIFVLVLAFSTSARQLGLDDSAALSRTGLQLFGWSVVLLCFAALILPSTQVVQAVQSEREGGALDLLALTGISPSRVLFGVLSFRAARVLLVLAGAAPLLCLIPTLGGVGVDQALGAAWVIGSLFLLSIGAGALLSVSARTSAVALVAFATWCLAIGVLAPLRLTDLVQRHVGDRDAVLTPFFYVGEPPVSAAGLLASTVPWLVVAAISAPLAAWRFRRGIASGWDPLARSWPGPRWGWIVHVLIAGGGWAILEITAPSREVLYLGTTVDMFDYAVFFGLGVVVLTSCGVLLLRALTWILPRLDLSRRRFRVPVVGDPIVWRELLTSGQGGVTRAATIATAAWMLIALLFVLSEADDELQILWAFLSAVGSLGLSMMLITSSILDERRRRTLPVLASTTLSSWAIVRGKLIGASVRVLPLVIGGVLLALWAVPELIGPRHVYSTVGLTFPLWINLGVPGQRLIGLAAWTLGLWFTLLASGAAVGIGVRNRALAGALPGVLATTVLLAVVILGLSLSGLGDRWNSRAIELVGDALFPLRRLLSEGSGSPGLPLGLLIAAGVWPVMAVVGTIVATWSMRRFGTRRG